MDDMSPRERAEQAIARRLCARQAHKLVDGLCVEPRCLHRVLAGEIAAALLDAPDAPAVLREEWDEDCGQQFEHGRAQGRDDVAADLAPLLALHRLGQGIPGRFIDRCTHDDLPWLCPTVAALPEHLRTEATR